MDLQSDLFTAYAAGFFDGEGSVILHRSSRVSLRGQDNHSRYHLRITVTNTHLGALQLLKERWGGGIHNSRTSTHRVAGTTRIVYWWSVNSRQAATFLRDVLPFLVVKQEQARVGIYFQFHMSSRGKARVGDEDLAFRQATYEIMYRLNHDLPPDDGWDSSVPVNGTKGNSHG